MENFGTVGAAQPEGETQHLSTGRLTAAQARVVDQWRARLLEDRPLPGQEPAGPLLRMMGIDDRPRASCSDALAAAVAALLAQGVEALALARYAEAGRRAAASGQPGAPRCQPVSFYLPGPLAVAADRLRAEARADAVEAAAAVWAQAAAKCPGDLHGQAAWAAAELARRWLPSRPRQVPRGALGRLAIDRWAARPPDQVAAAAVRYAATAHLQVHRARRDMRTLQA